MSNPYALLVQPIPTGILVSASSKICSAKKPTSKRKATPRAPASQIPWLWIVTFGSVAWSALILTIGLCTGQSERTQPAEPRPAFEPLAVAVPSAKPAAEMLVDDLAVESDPLPIGGGPKLLIRGVGVARHDTVPPAIQFEPVLVDETPLLSQSGLPNMRNAQKAQPRPPLRKDIDLNVFASCEQIGTNILFMKDPTEAFRKAREQKKLVFMVHLSGNLEDKEFT
jgi:hypothetical protein